MEVPTSVVAASLPGPVPACASPAPRGRFAPGWPLTWVLVGYPLWWILGLAQVLSLVAAVLLLVELLQRRRIHAPRGFLVWLLFLAWVLVGLVVLQVDAPGTVHGGSNTRYLTFGFRFAWYAAATIVLLYLGNMRKELSDTRIIRAFACLFVTTVAGGLLGTLAPHLDFPSAVELVLPRRITSIPFVRDLVHPVVAQLNLVDGVANPRASAPFAYTNGWALNFAVLLPFFLIGWFGPRAGWRRRVGPLVLAVALVPVIVSVNRGLWSALAVMAVFVAVRAAVAGNPRTLGTIMVGAAVVLILVSSTQLGDTVRHRLDNGYSDDGRANLSTTTVQTALEASPAVGFGTTRDVQGSFRSIADGSTASCPQCAPPALGTQGHLWGLVFATGAGGLALYLTVMLGALRRSLRLDGPGAHLGAAVIVGHLATMPFYDIIGIAMFAIAGGIGLIWRAQLGAEEAASARSGQPPAPGPTLGGYAGWASKHARTLVCCAVLGVASGAVVQHSRGETYEAEVSVLVAREPAYPGLVRRITTLDTIAQTVTGPAVQDAVGARTGRSWLADQRDVSVGAAPNTRILEITLSDPDAEVARAGAEATGEALLASRTQALRELRQQTLDKLEAEEAGLARAVASVNELLSRESSDVPHLEEVRADLTGQLNEVSTAAADVATTPVEPGELVSPARVEQVHGGWNVALASGLALGVLAGLVLSMLRRSAPERIRATSGSAVGGVPVLARVPETEARGGQVPASLLRATSALGPLACLPVGHDPVVRELAQRLDRHATGGADLDGRSGRVIVVLRADLTAPALTDFLGWATRLGLRVECAVVVDGSSAQPPAAGRHQ